MNRTDETKPLWLIYYFSASSIFNLAEVCETSGCTGGNTIPPCLRVRIYDLPGLEKCFANTDLRQAVLITDDHTVAAGYLEKGCCVIGVDHADDPRKVDFPEAEAATNDPAALTDDFIRMIHAHFHRQPFVLRETQRLIIRESTPEDFDSVRMILQECDDSIFADGLDRDSIGDRERFERYTQTAYLFFGYGIWTVLDKERQCVIGWCGLFPSSREEGNGYGIELGYVIGSAWRGCGYAYEACSAIISYAREELGCRVLCLYVPHNNEASAALARRLGFIPVWEGKGVICFEISLQSAAEDTS